MRFSLFFLTLSLFAQPPVAPTREPVGEARGAELGPFNITQSWEVGLRQHTVSGNEEKYRSDVNYGNGLRLLSSRLSLNARKPGALFDKLTLTTQGLGNDPYQSAALRISKDRLYRYDLLYRSAGYFNPALPLVAGLHRLDTERRIQDHDFTLLPQSKFRLFAGFSRNVQDGPALTTVNPYDDPSSNPVALFALLHRRQNEFRVGNEFQLLGLRLNWLQSWDDYREDNLTTLATPALRDFSRQQPYSGLTPRLRVSLFRERSRRYGLNGRFTHSSGRRDFSSAESATGLDRFAANRQIAVTGDARRPVTTANLTLSLLPTETLTLTNHTAFHSTRMEGRSSYSELNNGSLDFSTLNFDSLAIRLFTNSTDALLQLRPNLGLHAGFLHSERRVRSAQVVTIDGFDGAQRSEQNSTLNAGTAGFQLRPVKPLTLSAAGELGRQDQAFSLTAPKTYHALRARAQLRHGPLTLSSAFQSNSDFNQASLFTYSSRTNSLSADASYALRDGFSLESGYSRLHAATATGLAYFQAFALITNQRSVYLSNLHAAHLAGHLSFKSRADLLLGVTTTHDTASSFPFAFTSPYARLSLRLHSKLRYNAGYQFYRYREDLLAAQNYRAHTLYTSLLFTF